MVLRFLKQTFIFQTKERHRVLFNSPSQTATYEQLGKQTSNYNVCKNFGKEDADGYKWLLIMKVPENFLSSIQGFYHIYIYKGKGKAIPVPGHGGP
jgi:hypothetical protein